MKQKIYLLLFVLLVSVTSKAQSFTENFTANIGGNVNSFTRTLSGVPFTFTCVTNGDNEFTAWSNSYGVGNGPSVQLYSGANNTSTEIFVIKRQDNNDFVFTSLYCNNLIFSSQEVLGGYNNNVLVGSTQTILSPSSGVYNFGGIVVDEVRISSTDLSIYIDDFSGIIVEPATHLNFDGVNDFIALPNESNFDFTNQMTVEAWVKSSVAPEQWDALVIKGDNSWRLHLNSTGTVNFTCSGTSSSQVNSTSSVTDGNWHHVVGTLGGNSIKIYIDGVLENVVATSGNINNTVDQVLIGNNPTFGPRHFNGNMEDVRIWNVVRTAEQINGSKNCELQGNETGLVAYYKFNQGIDAADNTAIISLTDATANANNGTLFNFANTGATSNFLAGSPVTTGSIIPSVATVTTPVTYTQGATATALTATVGANGTSLVWYTTATGGTGTTAPIPSTATVGSTSYWVSSTNANGCESARTEILVQVALPATHLNFDGANDNVKITDAAAFDFTTAYTVEAMVKLNRTAGFHQTLVSKFEDDTNKRSWMINFGEHGGGALAVVMTPVGTWTNPLSWNTGFLPTIGTWYHIAVVFDSSLPSNQVKLYVDGALYAQTTWNYTLTPTDANVYVGGYDGLGNGLNTGANSRFLQGNIDELRMWNVAKTVEQINGSKNCELAGSEAGLVAYYKFNQGNDADNNSTITSLTDATSNANNGTLTNFVLTGTTSNWLAGSSVTTGSIVPSVATVTTPVVYNQNDTASALSATTGTNGSGLLWYTTATGGTSSATAPTPDAATVGNISYWVSSTNANGCESERTEIVVTVNALVPATHLNFDGVDDVVDLGSGLTTYFTNRTASTLEAWVKPETDLGYGVIIGNYAYPSGASSLQMLLRRDGSAYTFWINAGSGFVNVIANNTVTVNIWQHVAGTWDGSTLRIYINGVLINSVAATGNFSAITSNFVIGGNNQAIPEIFGGSIDEVRIWNVALTATDITNTMSCEAQAQPELVAYYKFNQGNDGVSNTSITTLTDSAGSNNGTLTNFALNGATSNWLAGSSVTTGNTCTVLEAEKFSTINNVIIYPNPSTGILNISLQEDANITVNDMLGKVIYTTKVKAGNNTIDISNYQAGMYLLNITNENGSVTKKLIKN